MNTPSIVLVHGWGFDSSVWQTLQIHLKETNTIAIDLPGYGEQKGNHTEWQINHLAEDLIARTPENAIWIAWSLGGLLALYIAANKTTHITALLTIAATPCFTQKPNWDCAMNAETFTSFKQSYVDDKEQCLKSFRSLVSFGADSNIIKQTHSQTCDANSATLLAGLQLLEQTDLRSSLKKIKCPSKFLFADNDVLIPANTYKHPDLQSGSNETLLINNASHALPISHPQLIRQQIEALIHATH